MSKFIEQLKQEIKVSKYIPKIVYAEGWNKDIVSAAKQLKQSGIIEPILIVEKKEQIQLDNLNIKYLVIEEMDLSKYANLLFELRKEKGMTLEEAKKLAKQPNYLLSLLIKANEADGGICGIEYTTKDTLKPALQIVKTNKKYKLVSSAFVMEKNDEKFIFTDCAININPTSEELSEITKMAIDFAINVANIKNPKVALLSYSTLGSGAGESVEKVRNAMNILTQDEYSKKANICGEIQFDAAYVDSIRTKKAKNCTWDTKADVYVFPNIDAGNIGYKIAQRMGGYSAFGPTLVGLAAPINDLSRGAPVEDVIGLSYITAIQIIANKKGN